MPITQIKQVEDYDLQSELDRKVLDTLEKLSMKYDTGQISEHQLSQSMQTLYQTCFGLVSDPSLQQIMDSYEPQVTASSCYYTKLKKGCELIYLTWQVNSESIEITTAYTGAVRLVEIPTEFSAHEYYNKVLNRLTQSGWDEFNDNNGVTEDD